MKPFSLLFSDLRSQFSDDFIDYSRIPDIPVRLDPLYVAKCSLLSNIDRKLIPSNPKELDPVTIDGFFRANEHCSQVALDPKIVASVRASILRDFNGNEINGSWVPYTWTDLLQKYEAIGPGASILSHGQNSIFEKFFVNDLTATRHSMYATYLRHIAVSPSRQLAELSRVRLTGKPYVLCAGSNLATVPKNSSTNRTICTEPSLNMMFQQALGNFLNEKLRATFGYDPASQPDRNRSMACQGSLDGSLCTIDLKSASDSISMRLCEQILPDWLFGMLEYCRSPYTCYKGKYHRLHMISSMGNGFTFPLQTYIFSHLLKVILGRVYRYDDARPSAGVFGDDIICPNDRFDEVCAALSGLGFTVNTRKSFAHGYFRESCGHDYYYGCNVRGIYVKTLSSVSDYYSACNRIIRFCANHRIIIDAWRLACRVKAPCKIPYYDSDSEGLKTPKEFARLKGHRYIYSAFVTKRRVFKPLLYDLAGNGILRRTHDNVYGFILSACKTGEHDISRRSSDVPQTSIERRVASFWDPRDLDVGSVKFWESLFFLK